MQYNSYGTKFADGKPRVSSMPYSYDIAEGNISGHTRWSKVGYTPTMTTADSDIWSLAGKYVFPTAATQMEVVSSLSTADVDIGTILHNLTCDAGGTTTTLLDAGVDFTAAVAVGDILIVDKSGTTPEWGVITARANGSLTFSGGLSSGGSCATARAYQVLDSDAAKGAMAVKVEYLTTGFVEKIEIVILNKDTAVPLINADTYRINSFRVIAVGTKATALNATGGNLSLKQNAALTYSYITAGFTRARNNIYTVPVNKQLYINKIDAGWGFIDAAKSQNQYCRLFTRANVEPSTNFKTGLIMYNYSEIITSSQTICVTLEIPTKFTAGTDIKVSGIASASGVATCVLRGWLEVT